MFKSYFSLITVSSHFYPVNLFLEHGRQFPMEFYQLLYSFIFKYDNWRQYVLCTQEEKTHSILVLFTARCFYCDWPRTFVSHSSIQWDIESKKNLIDIANLIKSCAQSWCKPVLNKRGFLCDQTGISAKSMMYASAHVLFLQMIIFINIEMPSVFCQPVFLLWL